MLLHLMWNLGEPDPARRQPDAEEAAPG
jgi:hypothetical protein